MRLAELAERLGLELAGDGDVHVTRVAPLESAGPEELSFVSGRKYLPLLANTRAGAVIVPPETETALPRLIAKNPYLAFAQALAVLVPEQRPTAGIHPSAAIDPSAELGEGVHIGPLVAIGARVKVGARAVVHPHVTLADDVVVGHDSLLHSGVQIREGCLLGARVVVQNGAVIGSDGFGFAKDEQGRYLKIPQVGRVVIEDDVEIGALTAIDRASLGETRIRRGTKLDNLVQIGHSVEVGEDTVMAAQCGIAGSTRIGRNAVLAGQVGVAGHLEIGERVVATAQTGIPHDVPAGTVVSGYPAIENRAWLKSSAVFGRLPELQKRVRELEARLARLEAKGGGG